MAIRVGWLPSGTQSAEDTRAATGALIAPTGLGLPRSGAFPVTVGSTPFALTATGSLSCSVGAGNAMVCPAATTYQGGYPVTIDSSGSGLPTVSFAAGGSLARTDVIYLQVQDTAEDASGFTQGQVAVQAGTNGGGVPTVPTGAIALWNVAIPASAVSIDFSTATYVAATTTAIGGVVPVTTSGSPANAHKGQVRARLDRTGTAAPGPLEVYDGTSWNPAQLATTPLGTVVTPMTQASSGTVVNSATETFDAVLGYLQATLIAGRRYRLSVDELAGVATVAGDWYDIRIRDSGSNANPTSASAQIAHIRWVAPVADSSGRGVSIPLTNTFLCTVSGVHTFGMSASRLAGTGTFTPVNTRTFIIEDSGNQ